MHCSRIKNAHLVVLYAHTMWFLGGMAMIRDCVFESGQVMAPFFALLHHHVLLETKRRSASSWRTLRGTRVAAETCRENHSGSAVSCSNKKRRELGHLLREEPIEDSDELLVASHGPAYLAIQAPLATDRSHHVR